MSTSGDFGNPLRKFKLVFLGEQSGKLIKIKHASKTNLSFETGHVFSRIINMLQLAKHL